MISNNQQIAAVISAYNEAAYIWRVLDVVSRVDILDEVIVVDDGSEDGTGGVVSEAHRNNPKITLVRHPTNQGKGQSIFTGYSYTRAKNLLLLDADLYCLTPQHVLDLIQP